MLLQEYNFEILHWIDITNLDANGLSYNLCPSKEDFNKDWWHRNCD
uniref:Uncharacterized protein n=1 Tax=Physcomitrium patens TaxID=3218 RepID=A0A2K1K380_PHYPA|nr:hypothetical protein PHYPA_012701 [Physcomitrium patens]